MKDIIAEYRKTLVQIILTGLEQGYSHKDVLESVLKILEAGSNE